MNQEERNQIDRMCHPRGMAIFGSVSRFGSFANSMLLNQIKFGYKGAIYPVSNRGGEVAGLKIYKSLDEIEGPVDLASVSVPARFVPQILEDCLAHGLAGAEVQSSGFAETGEAEGIELQRQMEAVAAKGLRLVGPNCFGIHCTRGGITLPPGGVLSQETGPVAMISQSGGMALNFAFNAENMGLKLSKVISYGNGSDLDAVDWMNYLADDDDTEYISAYIEGVSDGRAFVEAVRFAALKKPVVIWKGGLTPLGSRAAKSHTASLAGEAKIWNGLLAEKGVIAVQGLHELTDTLSALNFLKNSGPDIGLVGGGGAIGVFSSDLAYQWGLKMPTFSNETQEILNSRFPTPGNSVLNPLDTGTPALPLEFLSPMIKDIAEREKLDVLVIVMLLHAVTRGRPASSDGGIPPAGSDYLDSLLETVTEIKENFGMDVAMVFENPPQDLDVEAVAQQVRKKYQAEGIPVFQGAERGLRAIRNGLKAT